MIDADAVNFFSCPQTSGAESFKIRRRLQPYWENPSVSRHHQKQTLHHHQNLNIHQRHQHEHEATRKGEPVNQKLPLYLHHLLLFCPFALLVGWGGFALGGLQHTASGLLRPFVQIACIDVLLD